MFVLDTVDPLDEMDALDEMDVLDESIEPPAMPLDPVQVAGTYGDGFSSAMMIVYVSGTHLEFTFGMDRHTTKFAGLSQFAQTPDRRLGLTCHKFRHRKQWGVSFYLAVATSGWYGEGCALEVVRPLFPLITVEGFADCFDFCEQDLLRRSMSSQVMHGINEVLSA